MTMKIRKAALFIALGAALGVGGSLLVPRLQHRETAAPQGPLYHCPMHPNYTSDVPGDCAICGMKLVPIEQADAGKPEHRIAFYRSPMNAADTSPVPRKDSMGMDYVPVYQDEVSGEGAVSGLVEVKIDAQRQQLIGLRTAEVTRGTISGDWRTVGRIAADETRIRKINVKVDGFVEKLFVDFVGKPVRRGEPLFALYSPDLLNAQNDYALAVRTRSELGGSRAGDDLVAAARRRLELWDVPRSEIAHLDHGGAPIRDLILVSPISGVVTAKTVVQGSRIAAGDTPFEVTDLSQVWVLADAHESDLPRVQVGTPVSLTLDAVPNRTFTGKVSFIEPVLDPKTRTAKVRLAFPNPRGELRLEMFGEVVFHTRPHESLRVPADSIIDSGDRKVVFVATGEGRFEPREVRTGEMGGDMVEVVSGVRAGEHVVVRASFLVDSESRLKAALAALASKPPAAPKPQGRGAKP
ncbi:MAG TPA: efflux RND transporter periplasmic adaptor subunit [Myxococcales bacterium]|nr:efflux RND transporter periplasmic adaptor subunit [Myxococcales bacterium]